MRRVTTTHEHPPPAPRSPLNEIKLGWGGTGGGREGETHDDEAWAGRVPAAEEGLEEADRLERLTKAHLITVDHLWGFTRVEEGGGVPIIRMLTHSPMGGEGIGIVFFFLSSNHDSPHLEWISSVSSHTPTMKGKKREPRSEQLLDPHSQVSPIQASLTN